MGTNMLSRGDRIGDYVVEAKVGGGGFGTVYRVRDSLGNVRALKVLDPKLRADQSHRARFLDEARIQLTRLNHPNIVKVHEILATDDVAAMVMEYVAGVDLSEYIESRRVPVSYDEFRAVALPVLDAVQHAHEQGVIHRDLKPGNILITRVGDRIVPKVTDFGVAKVLAESAKKKSTATGATIGTTGYMSPEQIRNSKNVTARSDVFSLGALLYELASGTEPFIGDSDYDVMNAIVNGRFRRTADVAPMLPVTAAAAIDRGLSPNPAARFASCTEFSQVLRSDLGNIKQVAPRPGGDRGPTSAMSRTTKVGKVMAAGRAASTVAIAEANDNNRPSTHRRWRDGRYLVLDSGGCVRSCISCGGQVRSRYRVQAWERTRIGLYLLYGPVAVLLALYVVVAALEQQISAMSESQTDVLATAMLLGLLVLSLVSGYSYFSLRADASFEVGLCERDLGKRRRLRVRRARDGYVWLAGVPSKYLTALPSYPRRT